MNVEELNANMRRVAEEYWEVIRWAGVLYVRLSYEPADEEAGTPLDVTGWDKPRDTIASMLEDVLHGLDTDDRLAQLRGHLAKEVRELDYVRARRLLDFHVAVASRRRARLDRLAARPGDIHTQAGLAALAELIAAELQHAFDQRDDSDLAALEAML